jgi:hypothetical protein
MKDPTITCPTCQADITLSEALIGPALEAERQKIKGDVLEQAARLKSREEKLHKEYADLKESQAGLEQQVQKQVEQATEEIAKQEQAKAEEAARLKLDNAHKQIETDKARIQQMEEDELLVRKDRAKLREEKQSLELKVQRTMDEERQQIREKAMQDAASEYEHKLAEADKQLLDTRKQLDVASRKAAQRSQQLQGEVQELSLEATLRAAFPLDVIEPVAKGQQGGDVLQHVVAPGDRQCGTILWESKRTKNWSDQWLQKLRDDQRAAEADVAIILSTTMPKSITRFGQLQGVWVTDWESAIALAGTLRHTCIQIASAKVAAEGQDHKMAAVYDYLTNPKFQARIESIVEAAVSMQTDLATEKRAMTKQWSKRDANIKRMIDGAAGMHSDLQGIAGSALADVPGLGFDPPNVIETKQAPRALPDSRALH